jgi:uncharacterized BrkB/YihY/UPF0761 family membrane protein
VANKKLKQATKQRLLRALIFGLVSIALFAWALIPTSKLAEQVFGRHLIDDSQALGLIVPFFGGVIFAGIALTQLVVAWYKSVPSANKSKWVKPS